MSLQYLPKIFGPTVEFLEHTVLYVRGWKHS